MTLHLHRGADVVALADGLAALLATPQADPLAPELVVVPARGVERWLAQRLSHRLGVGARGGDGVCAGVDFVAPRSLVAMLLGRERDDPWDPDRLVWPLLRVIDEALDEPWLAPVARHLGHGLVGVPEAEGALREGRRYAVARHIAGLVADYAAQRPALLIDWRAGNDTDGLGGALEPDLAWQAELYRRLLRRVDADPPEVRHAATCAALAAGGADPADLPDLPPRLSLFGHTRLPRTQAELLRALAVHRDVHLWLPQASPALWRRLADLAVAGPVPRAQDDSAALVAHPLLASLARDARELQRTLALAGPAVEDVVADPAAAGPPTLLRLLQDDLRADAPPDARTRAARTRRPDDDSVTVHACHGPARQVEVLRDVLAGLLADDPTLEPRDVLVMCPDIETYAPLFQAAFGLGDTPSSAGAPIAGAAGHPAHAFRVRLADRALTSTNPLFTVALALLALVGARVTVSQVLDLLGSAPVRRRFRLDDDDLAQVRTWVEDAGIRWGLDAAHRAAYQLSGYGQNTWRFGLDRLLLGVGAAHAAPAGDAGDAGLAGLAAVLPVPDVGSGDIDLVGRLAEALDRLDVALAALSEASSAAEWTQALGAGVNALAEADPGQAWQEAELDRELDAVRDAADPQVTLRLPDVRHLLTGRLAGRPTRANFRTGTLTVCTMVPMRSVPHRVVALVGLDDGVFPRSPSLDGDDVLARRPVTGERDARSEDRQLLLDAVMAAREHLVVTYTGASEHHGLPVPPAVPLGELVDALRDTIAPPPPEPNGPGRPAPDAGDPPFVVRHPLQPFDPRALDAAGPFSFDPAALAGALAGTGPRDEPPSFLPSPLPAAEPGDVALSDLRSFFAHPARAFLRDRLGVAAFLDEEEPSDAMPVELDGLATWGVGDRLLSDALAGLPPDAARRAEFLRGLLPPAALGHRKLDEVGALVDALVAASADLRTEAGRAVDVAVDLPGRTGAGRRLSGTVGGVVASRVVTVTYSSLGARQRLASWIDLLALTAAHPDTPWTSHVVARRGRRVTRVSLGPLTPQVARDHLADLVDVRDRGLREPIPLPPKTALAYAQAVERVRQGEDADPREAATREWATGETGFPGEADHPAHVRVYGLGAGIDALLGAPAPGESWNRGVTRLGQYALHVWGPILAAERFGAG